MNALNSGILSTLQGGTALTSLLSGGTAAINYMQAPDKSTFPYVLFSIQGGGDLNISPSRMKDELYFVRGYSKTSPANAGTIDAQIDALLHNKTITVTGWTNYRTQRETDMENEEVNTAGEHIYMAGGVYRISIDS